MSGYPVPPAEPSSRARGGARVAETPKSVLLERVGAGLGVLMFVWGFLPWYGLAATDVNGYGFGSPAPVAIGLSLLASGVAAARMLDQKAASPLVPLAAAAVALLVSFGLIVDRGDNVSLNVGLILAVVTTLLQTAAFALAWLHEIGRLGVRGAIGPLVGKHAVWLRDARGWQQSRLDGVPGADALCRSVRIHPVGVRCRSRLRRDPGNDAGVGESLRLPASRNAIPAVSDRVFPAVRTARHGLAVCDRRLRSVPRCCPEPVAIRSVDPHGAGRADGADVVRPAQPPRAR